MGKVYPKVSIVTPSFNAMPYIKETIKSIHSQNYPNLEHIIFDGASTDGTSDWIRENYPEIDYTSEKDRGQSHALNKGFSKASGEIIGWLNADDTYEPNSIQTAVDFLMEHPEYDLVCSDLNIIDEKSNKVGITLSEPFHVEGLFLDNKVKQPTVFMRKRVIEALNGLDERYHYVMDREFWLRVGIAGYKMYYMEGVRLANFRLIQGTKSFEDVPNFRNEWYEVMKKAFKDPFFNHISSKQRKTILSKNRGAYHMSKMIQSIDSKERVQMVSHMYKAVQKNKSLILNRGFWKFFFLGITGMNSDRIRKFKKLQSLNSNAK